MSALIISAKELLSWNLSIPNYQRPYKWTRKNIEELLNDIKNAIEDFEKYNRDYRYRVGTVILHKTENNTFDVVDGQQRLLSLTLINLVLDNNCKSSLQNVDFENKTTQVNLNDNFKFIKEWFSYQDESLKTNFVRAMDEILEFVVVSVGEVSAAFQLFDSQNTRGKALDPHDLLKAYHLREMKSMPYEMERAVTKWESKKTEHIKNLFGTYLFPIWNWSRCQKSSSFSSRDIDTYKGASERFQYTYAKRANKASPFFQITEPFMAGNDFFEMVDHYLTLLDNVTAEIQRNEKFEGIDFWINNKAKLSSSGFRYARDLFYAALLCYYDRFHNFEEMVVKKLFIWSFMIRVDMKNLGYDTINKYAIGEWNDDYSNVIPMFSKIIFARSHREIANVAMVTRKKNSKKDMEKWEELHRFLKKLNGEEVDNG